MSPRAQSFLQVPLGSSLTFCTSDRQSLADTLRELPHQQFVAISERMYEAMMARVELIRVLGEVLGDLLQETRQVLCLTSERVGRWANTL